MRRSGTSMLMYALKEAGLDIVGKKFNSTRREENPNGYWEIPEICTETGLQIELKGDVIKIMFEALSFSKPELIDKTVMIFRKPKNMLTSMKNNDTIDYMDLFLVKQLLDTVDTLVFLKDKPLLIVFYEDILEDPKGQMKVICDYLRKGDYKKASKAINTKLNRSKESEGNEYITVMENVYDWAREGNIDKILKLGTFLENRAKRLIRKIDGEENIQIQSNT